MGKRSRTPRPARNAEVETQRDIRFSRGIFIAALFLVVAVAAGDVWYVAMQTAKHHGHLYIPAIVVAAPIAAIFFVALTWWNWRSVARRSAQRPQDLSAPTARR